MKNVESIKEGSKEPNDNELPTKTNVVGEEEDMNVEGDNDENDTHEEENGNREKFHIQISSSLVNKPSKLLYKA